MKLSVNTSRPYDIIIEDSFLEIENQIKKVFSGRKLLIVCDSITKELYLEEIKEKLSCFELFEYAVLSGEKSKNIENYVKIIEFLAENSFNRNDGVLALGGGVVGDLAGFVSATYMRGSCLIQCPTTLLSCVDSSIGGKTGVDLKQGKNLVGAFYQPSLTYINVSTLNTLPKREIESGFGEVIKYAFLSKTVSKKLLKEGVSKKLILECVKIKAQIVAEDEFDSGKRALLNLGHTVGHAIETLNNFTLSHGVSVAIGIEKVIEMSKRFYHLTDEKVLELKDLLALKGYEVNIKIDKEEIVEQICHDKKTTQNTVSFILIKDIGDVRVEKLSFDKIRELL